MNSSAAVYLTVQKKIPSLIFVPIFPSISPFFSFINSPSLNLFFFVLFKISFPLSILYIYLPTSTNLIHQSIFLSIYLSNPLANSLSLANEHMHNNCISTCHSLSHNIFKHSKANKQVLPFKLSYQYQTTAFTKQKYFRTQVCFQCSKG